MERIDSTFVIWVSKCKVRAARRRLPSLGFHFRFPRKVRSVCGLTVFQPSLRSRVLSLRLLTLGALFLVSPLARSTSLPPGFRASLVAAWPSSPTGMVFAPDGRVFVSDQIGYVWLVKNGVRQEGPGGFCANGILGFWRGRFDRRDVGSEFYWRPRFCTFAIPSTAAETDSIGLVVSRFPEIRPYPVGSGLVGTRQRQSKRERTLRGSLAVWP